MNLKNMFEKDASLQNLTWLSDPETFEPSDKDDNKKDDLELQWGFDSLDPSMDEDSDLAGSPILEAKSKRELESEEVMRVSKLMMMRGLTGKKFIAAMRQTVGDGVLSRNKSVVASVLKNEGILGCVAVDSSPFRNCREALEFAKSVSPNKRYIKYALLNENCPGCREAMEKEVGRQKKVAGGGSVDGFFTESVESVRSKHVCSVSNLPIIAGRDDFDESDMDDTLIDLVNIGKITQEECDEIRGKSKSAFQKTRDAFLLLERKSSVDLYRGKVNTGEFVVEPTDMEVNFPEYVTPENLDIDRLESTIDVDLGISTPNVDVEDISVDPDGMDISFGDNLEMEPVDLLDENGEDFFGEIDLNNTVPQDIDVDSSTYVEPEFEGSDLVDVDPEEEPDGLLDIDMTSDLEI